MHTMPSTVVMNTKSDPTVVVNISSLSKLTKAGIEIHQWQETLCALRIVAQTRPLTLSEQADKEMAEVNMEVSLDFLRNNDKYFARLKH